MPETKALLRLSWERSRVPAAVMAMLCVIGVTIALLAGPIQQDDAWGKMPILALVFTLLPAGLATMVLFDYSNESHLDLPESGCSHWLLRMPIQSWKIAIVPAVLKSLWVSVIWVAFALVAQFLGTDGEIPIFAPSLVFSAAAIALMIVGWRPFRRGWHRIAALVVSAFVFYGSAGLVLVAPFIKQVEWRPTAVISSQIASVLLYAGVFWLLVRCVGTARTNILGLVLAGGERRLGFLANASEVPARDFKSPRHALVFHDLLQQRAWIRNTFILGVIPFSLMIILLVPLGIPTVVLTLILFGYLGVIAISRMGATGNTVFGLPPYLAASPLSTATIAWTRFVAPMAIATIVYSFVVVPIAGLALWPGNRAVWNRWAADLAHQAGSSEPFWVGVGWTIAIVIAAGVFMLGRIATYFWVAMAGRSWLNVVMAFVAGFALLVPLGVLIRWFLQQKDWESTQASALQYATWIPTIVAVLVVVKAVALVATSVAISSRQLAAAVDQAKVIGIWIALVLSIAVALVMLVPDPRVTLLWCLAFTTLAIPVSRVMILPLMVDFSRHR